ncbi:MAG: hypothetical protein ACHP84_03265 [Caulobacterales bacterium]
MSRRARTLLIIQQRWLARFGEPPAILTDPKLMLQILDSPGERRPTPTPETPRES